MAGTIDEKMAAHESFVDVDSQSRFFRGLDAAVGVQRARRAADLIAERMVPGKFATRQEIGTAVIDILRIDRGPLAQEVQRPCKA
jgi:hypothetical protein